MILRPDPQPGDRAGKTSRFIGRLPEHLVGKDLVAVVPNLTISGRHY